MSGEGECDVDSASGVRVVGGETGLGEGEVARTESEVDGPLRDRVLMRDRQETVRRVFLYREHLRFHHVAHLTKSTVQRTLEEGTAVPGRRRRDAWSSARREPH
jgi:hypothetical protein